MRVANFDWGNSFLKRSLLALGFAIAYSAAGCGDSGRSVKPNNARSTSQVAHPNTYATDFARTEDRISEDDRWINGRTVGLDWGDVSTSHGRAIGHSGPARYSDATALLSGNWKPDQAAQATVYGGLTHRNPEVELRLRSSLSAHRATGYEISERVCADDSGYLIIVRWNGPLADFTYLARLSGKQFGVKTGDIVKATIVGDVITAYKNGVQLAQVTDNNYASGSPGIGFNEGENGDYGFTSFWASDDVRAFDGSTNLSASDAAAVPITAPLKQSSNPHYFADAGGKPLVLCGSQTWNTLQDWGTNGRVQQIDFDAFVTFLTSHRHNFTLLWTTELPKFHGLPTAEVKPPDFVVSPLPWMRTGPGQASDGEPKFDLTKFNPNYFDRLRARVAALNKAGIYVGVYPFTGEWLRLFRSATDGYPFSGPNNQIQFTLIPFG